jgi:carboxyl-terminal processing protease
LALGLGHCADGRSQDYSALGRQVVSLVGESFFDADRGRAWADEHEHYADGIATREDFAPATRRALAKLGASHTTFYAPHEVEYWHLAAIFREPLGLADVSVESIGADVRDDGYVRTVFAGGPAAAAGLQRGDRIVSADGKPFDRLGSLTGRAERPVVLGIRPTRGEGPLSDVRVIPRKMDPKVEWLEAQKKGTRIVDSNGVHVGYVPLFTCAGEEYQEALSESLADGLSKADALVIDFRGGWGGCSQKFLQLFDPHVPVLTLIDRAGRSTASDPVWRKPLVLLVDEGTRSGKEMVAAAVKEHGLGRIVGRRTGGAVLAGRCTKVADAGLLFLAVADVRVNGQRLEGVGVAPDVEVPDDLPYAQGADRALDAAVDEAVRMVQAARP